MIVALIPARGGSKRVPNKNLEQIGGKSLVARAVETAIFCRGIDEVYVSTDKPEIAIEAAKFGADFYYRADHAALDNATDADVVSDFFAHLSYPVKRISMIIYLRPTSPFRKVFHVSDAIGKMLRNINYTGLRSVHEMSESAFKCMRFPDTLGSEIRTFNLQLVDEANRPNQQCIKTYSPNGIVDIMRTSTIADGKLFGDRVYGYKTEQTIEIDTTFDLKLARAFCHAK